MVACRLEVINFAFTLVFVAEMCLKIAGLGYEEYASDVFNRFDAVIVLTSIVEMAVVPPTLFCDGNRASAESPVDSIAVMRTFRLLRVLKLMTRLKRLRSLVTMVIRVISAVANFAVLLGLFLVRAPWLGLFCCT